MNWKNYPGKIRVCTSCILRYCRKKGPTGDCIVNFCIVGRFCGSNHSS